MASNFNCLSLLNVAHGATVKIGVKHLRFDQLHGLVAVSACRIKSLFSWPDGCNTHNSYTFWHTRVHFHLSTIGDYPKKWSAILDKKFVLLDFKHLSLEQTSTDIVREIGLEYVLK